MPYLDYAGAGRASDEQMKEVAEMLGKARLSNPHSQHASSRATRQLVDSARNRVLSHFHVSPREYDVVFTYNTTHSLRIVAENFSFSGQGAGEREIGRDVRQKGSKFAYLLDSHNSVVGVRECVRDRMDRVVCVEWEELVEQLGEQEEEEQEEDRSLFVLTAMSNFCGRKYDLTVVERLRKKGWSVCLDAASLVSCCELDLSVVRPDFVCFSFYKMFGYPTGLGCLLVKKESACLLEKRVFAGGTVAVAAPRQWFAEQRKGVADRLEDGTTNYYAVAALQAGFDEWQRRGGVSTFSAHAFSIARQCEEMLRQKMHWNGKKAVQVYARGSFEDPSTQGPIIAFNVLRDDGSYVGYSEVEKMCDLFGVELRAGCFCNMGACQGYLGIDTEQLRDNYLSGKECGDQMDVIDGRPVGAVRVSFGAASSVQDVAALDLVLECCFLAAPSEAVRIPHDLRLQDFHPTLSQIVSYPVKSVTGKSLQSSALTPSGLRFDRHFMVTANDVTITQKRYPQMCTVRAEVDTDSSLLLLSHDTLPDTVSVPLTSEAISEQTVVCADSVSTVDCGPVVGEWLDRALGLANCRLKTIASNNNEATRSLSNDSPYLLINEASASVLAGVIDIPVSDVLARFRANLVVRGLPPFVEDAAETVNIGGIEFEVSGKCTRCEMICVDPATGEKDPALIVALRKYRFREKMTFGIYLRQKDPSLGGNVCIGDSTIFE